jgi:RNA recognition motif-containing protein
LNKGYAFLKFRDQEEALKAISEMNGFIFNGKAMKVSTAHSNNKPEVQQDN